MIKKISAVFLCVCLVSCVFAACSKDGENTDEAGGLQDSVVDYGFEVDEEGNTVAVIYEDGKAYVLDADGNITNKTIDNPKNMPNNNGKSDNSSGNSNETPSSGPTTVPDRGDIDNNTGGAEGTTDSELTTLPLDKDQVPNTSASGDPVKFSDSDIKIITNMLEVPYLYTENFESNQNVPISVATHVACWMLQRQNLDTNTFASGPVVIELFNYFAKTVISFKTECNTYTADNAVNPAPIRYNSNNDTFTITGSSYENHTHTVNIKEIQSLGNNNYYKVIANVKGIDSSCKKTSVVAVIQKNKLDTSLGFSIKALQWK